MYSHSTDEIHNEKLWIFLLADLSWILQADLSIQASRLQADITCGLFF